MVLLERYDAKCHGNEDCPGIIGCASLTGVFIAILVQELRDFYQNSGRAVATVYHC
jgi:hypothetical protein